MVRVEERDDVGPGVFVVTIERPERRNAIDHATLLALLDAFEQAATARVIVLTGAPPAFCAGADLSGVSEQVFSGDLRRLLETITQLRQPVIAAIDGPAMGAGAQLAAVSDLRVATPTSKFAVPAARLGLVIDHWTVERLTREFTWPVTRAMLLAAEVYTGERLYALGAVHRLGDLTAAMQWAAEIAQLAPLSVAGHKLALETSGAGPAVDELVQRAREAAWTSSDADEGRRAFMEKRPAVFRGS